MIKNYWVFQIQQQQIPPRQSVLPEAMRRFELNGAVFENTTNNFSINGLTIQATALTGNEAVTITTDTDVDGIYDTIKDMLSEYNELIKTLDTAYNAESAKGYEPLTDDEKESMSDDEVEKVGNKD